MGLLRKLGNEQSYLKANLYGFAGSGKTWTASLIAVGLAKQFGFKRVAFYDTETGSSFVEPNIFKPAGVELVGMKSRTFKSLIDFMHGCIEEKIQCGLADSVSHVYQELIDAYLEKHNKTRMAPWDWKPVKNEWRKFTDLFLSSPMHFIQCGRAGFTYEETVDEDGTKGIKTSGVKMKSETESQFEPNLVIRMVQESNYSGKSQEFTQVAYVEKDRTDTINGKVFISPTYEHIKPHIDFLNKEGVHNMPDPAETSIDALKDKDWSAEDRKKRKDKALGEIKATLEKYFDARTKGEKQKMIAASEKVFNVKSWEGIEQAPLDTLEAAVSTEKLEISVLESVCIELSKESK